MDVRFVCSCEYDAAGTAVHVSPTESPAFRLMFGQCDVLVGRHHLKRLHLQNRIFG